ncbi:P-loop containing nucleoside triphosphate hydrolase protein [Aulographum hederae CBS 113979]|uniref:P-loop containing nucleoside triphosphate hydrolase protein n=1 Tax=Aulographum hederae CBS 113979 TaxID=1176131 RepID=A0A6G1HHR0_9PEZI|nr:P-loop containing nucleoside triphosphate hydrolase protein [Aulographum hederae CBS 113979]
MSLLARTPWKRSIHSVSHTLRCVRTYAQATKHDVGATLLPPTIQLRPYQEECIQAVLTNLAEGKKRLGLSLPTGAGKTVVFTRLIDRIQPPTPKATQTLILSHRKELVEQAAHHCRNAYPSKTIEVEMASTLASGAADITVGSIASLLSRDRIEKFVPDRFKLIIIDEAHHAVSQQYLKALEYFKLRPPEAESPALVAVSATLSRFDGVALSAVIDHIAFHKDLVDMINERWLSDVLVTTVRTRVDLSSVQAGSDGDFRPTALSPAVNTPAVNDLTVRAWRSRAEGRKSTLVFCVDVHHLQCLKEEFRKQGIRAEAVTALTPQKKRSVTIDEFKKGEFPVLLNVGVFTEGTDIPNIDCVVLARPTKSRNLLVQMLGRGLRLHKDKQNCQIIDMVGDSIKTGIVTTPTLFGLDPDSLVEEKDSAELLEEAKKQQKEKLQSSSDMKIKSVVLTDYDSINDLIEDSSGERHIRAISICAWVQVKEGKYILSSKSGSYLSISQEPESEHFVVIYLQRTPFTVVSKGKQVPYMKPRKIASAPKFEDAVHAADTFAKETFEWIQINKTARWRDSPATEKQLTFLNKTRKEEKTQLTPEDITMGKAGDMITKLIHGAKGQFEKIQSQSRQLQKMNKKAEDLRMREVTRVGPVGGPAVHESESGSDVESVSQPATQPKEPAVKRIARPKTKPTTYADYWKSRQTSSIAPVAAKEGD